MTQNENLIIAEVANEYSQYIASGRKGNFKPSQKANEGLSRLARELERKRQVANLTAPESMWLRQIDELMERISRYNKESSEKKEEEPKGVPVYDMAQNLKLEESQTGQSLGVPKISQKQADEIIEVLDRQFEEKVMKRVRKRHQAVDEKNSEPEPTKSIGSARSEADTGRNLQDYLTAMRAERPEVPFADSDSKFDLSKLAARP